MQQLLEDARHEARTHVAAACENVRSRLDMRVSDEVDRIDEMIEELQEPGAERDERAMRNMRNYLERAQDAAGSAEQSQLKAIGVLDRLSALEHRLEELRENNEMAKWLGIDGIGQESCPPESNSQQETRYEAEKGEMLFMELPPVRVSEVGLPEHEAMIVTEEAPIGRSGSAGPGGAAETEERSTATPKMPLPAPRAPPHVDLSRPSTAPTSTQTGKPASIMERVSDEPLEASGGLTTHQRGPGRKSSANSSRVSSAAASRLDSGRSQRSANSTGGGTPTAYHVVSFDAKAEASIREVKDKVDAFELGQRKLHAAVNRMNIRMDDLVAQHDRLDRRVRVRGEKYEHQASHFQSQIERLEMGLERKADVDALEGAVEDARRAAAEAIAAADADREAERRLVYAGSTYSCISCFAPLENPGVGPDAPTPPQMLPMMASTEFSSGGVSRVALLPTTHRKGNVNSSVASERVNTPNGGGFFGGSGKGSGRGPKGQSSLQKSPYAGKVCSPMSARARMGGVARSASDDITPRITSSRSAAGTTPRSHNKTGGQRQSIASQSYAYGHVLAVDSELRVNFSTPHGAAAASPPDGHLTVSPIMGVTPEGKTAAMPTAMASPQSGGLVFYGVPSRGETGGSRPMTAAAGLTAGVNSMNVSPLEATLSQTLLAGEMPRNAGDGGVLVYDEGAGTPADGRAKRVVGGGEGGVGGGGKRGASGMVRPDTSSGRQGRQDLQAEHVWGGL